MKLFIFLYAQQAAGNLPKKRLNEEIKIMVMLFAATCSELELEVWEMMRQGESPASIDGHTLSTCLLMDMGLSPKVKKMDAQQKNEKVREATLRVKSFFEAIGIEVNDF
ncbi:MAG: hypothetical protein LBJ96_04310 [Holosporaceae bacterium]|nr:hypothetical protein [Holosporaceae bacterium]